MGPPRSPSPTYTTVGETACTTTRDNETKEPSRQTRETFPDSNSGGLKSAQVSLDIAQNSFLTLGLNNG